MKNATIHGAAALAFLAVAAAVAGDPAVAADRAVEGRRLADRWCVECHIVGLENSGSDIAPPFAMLANDPSRSREDLQNWLRDPHPPMPDPGLDQGEIEAVLDWIYSLRTAD